MSELLSTALITGASRGTAGLLAEVLARKGYQTYITYVSKADGGPLR